MSKGLYLDTNIVFGLFDRQLERLRKGKNFKIPERLKLLHSKGTSLYVSIVTRSELFIKLKERWNITPREFSELESLWMFFLSTYKIIELVPGIPPYEHIVLKDVYSCVKHGLSIKTEVTNRIFGYVDFIHLYIAKINQLTYLTAERNLNKIMLKRLNEIGSVINWGRFRRLFG